jgi:DNA polymerase-3 subunit epsilon
MSPEETHPKRPWNLKRLWPGGPTAQSDNEPLENIPFVVLDTETTGLNPERDRILSIGALRLQGGRIMVREALELYLQQEHFDSDSVPIHGILREDLHPRIPEAEALRQLVAYTGDAVIVGHHIGFDLAVLHRAMVRQGVRPPGNPCLDTGLLYRKTLLKTPLLRKKEFYTLDDLARRFDLPCTDRHTALGDALLTALALAHILELLKAKGVATRNQLLRAGKVG